MKQTSRLATFPVPCPLCGTTSRTVGARRVWQLPYLEDVTQRLVTVALQKTHSHTGEAAALLGIHPRTLTRMLRRYGLPEVF